DDDRDRDGLGREMQKRLRVISQKDRGGGDRRGESDRGRDPSGKKSDRRVIDLRKVVVFAAGARKDRSDFSVGERAAKRGDAADDPEQQDARSGVKSENLEAEASEDSGSDHVGDDDGDGGVKTDPTCGGGIG